MAYIKYFILFFIIVIGIGTVQNIFALSPFPEQFIDGPTGIYFQNYNYDDKTNALDLEGVFYRSDGKSIEAKLILNGQNGFSSNNTLSFGMLIDSDSNFKTGKGGYDYRYRVQWDNGQWFEILDELATSSINLKEISKKQIQSPFYPDSVDLGGLKSSLEISLDLEQIKNPKVLAIVFFSEGQLSGKTQPVQDVLSLAVIPPPTFIVKTNPSLISFESSTEKIIHILVESNLPETTDLYYNVYSDSNTTTIEKLIENKITLKEGKGEIPILLYDKGHNDLKIYNLLVNLSPWYPLNPETKSINSEQEIYEKYYLRNQQNSYAYSIFWTSLAQPGWDWQLIIQIAMLGGTFVMVVLGIITYRSNSKLANYSRNEKHTHQILGVYDLMLSLIPKVDHMTKKLTLKYPEDYDDQLLVRTSPVEFHAKRSIELSDFNNKNIDFYDSAIKHLRAYPELNKKWSLLSETISQYDKEVELLKQEIRKTFFDFITEKLPDFRMADGNSGKIYFLDGIEWEAYEVLSDAMSNLEPRFTPNYSENKLSNMYAQIEPNTENDKTEYDAFLSRTMFSSPEPLPDEINSLLGIVLIEPLKKKYESLIKLEQQGMFQLDAFRIDMKELVKQVNNGVHIKGKCNLGY